MNSLWNSEEAKTYGDDPLQLRVYTSRLLGREPSLVLHGGGNTSVKAAAKDIFGDEIETLYVKGSGWDLATIEAAGFAPVRLNVLRRMAELDTLTDSEMVKAQRAAMLDPAAPNPSVEAILHAIIPFKYVDHTHTDAVVTITNTPDGEQYIRDIYGERVLVIPYVMPGFILAKTIHNLTRGTDWARYEGMVLLNHGLFTFSDSARESYESMIRLVSEAEAWLEAHAPLNEPDEQADEDLLALARMRAAVSDIRGEAVVARLDSGSRAVAFSRRDDVADIATRGTLTPDHVIRTKAAPVVVENDVTDAVERYAAEYRSYFERNSDASLSCLDPAPRWAVWPGFGCVSFDRSVKAADIISDIKDHTLPAILRAELLGGWRVLAEKEMFEMEYWELEQAKLKKGGVTLEHQGKVALVTGAASGIGKACAELLHAHGAAVVALDINPEISTLFDRPDLIGIACDVTDDAALKSAVDGAVRRFGGLDIVVSNAGIFPVSEHISELKQETWDRSLSVNLTSHQRLLHHAAPYLALGVNPAVVIIASRNVLAPGPGAAAYSVAKAGLTQLGRVAAMEFAGAGVRVNMLHPDAVFDTAIWTDEVLKKRAANYGLSVEQYRTRNLLGVEISSRDVAELVAAMAGPLFAKTTGAQLPVDGGNERVI
ncbi:MAG: bifunctional aldolase/short-chain dehydrogenase [Mariprofundaceae bacterium]|nr:bifunctional aldolase/short-chain dehydrogenase [Mariprofundaceae bacterium]